MKRWRQLPGKKYGSGDVGDPDYHRRHHQLTIACTAKRMCRATVLRYDACQANAGFEGNFQSALGPATYHRWCARLSFREGFFPVSTLDLDMSRLSSVHFFSPASRPCLCCYLMWLKSFSRPHPSKKFFPMALARLKLPASGVERKLASSMILATHECRICVRPSLKARYRSLSLENWSSSPQK